VKFFRRATLNEFYRLFTGYLEPL